MGNKMYRQIEEFEKDYDKIFDKGAWDHNDIVWMKDLQKLMYYIEVRCAMKKEQENRDYEEEEMRRSGGYGRSYDGYGDYSNSYARNMPPRRYMSGTGSRSYGAPYGDYSGRRSYDDKEEPMEKFRRMASTEQDPEKRAMMEEVMRMLENR